jgi:hypothetical protein
MSFLILLAASAASAALVGSWAARRRLSPLGHALVCAVGIATVLAFILAEATITFDGNCYALDDTATVCTLAERLGRALDLSLTNGWPYFAAWLLIYFTFQGRGAPGTRAPGRSDP